MVDVFQTPYLAHYPRVASHTLLVFKTDFNEYYWIVMVVAFKDTVLITGRCRLLTDRCLDERAQQHPTSLP